jgi:3-oxoadipate enol-lactonase
LPYINVNQSKVFYFDNKIGGIPVVFIHGFLGSSLDWINQFCYFNPKYHLILLDLPGFGSSDKPRDNYSIEFFSSIVYSVLTAFAYNKIILVGHSLGGMIAQHIASNHPKLVKKLILISATYSFSSSFCDKINLLFVNIIFKFFYKKFLKSVINRIISKREESKKFRTFYNKALNLPKHVILSTFKNMTLRCNLKSNLSHISAPTLIIHGTNDKIILSSMVNTMNTLISSSEMIEINAAPHRLMIENHEKVNRILDTFIIE